MSMNSNKRDKVLRKDLYFCRQEIPLNIIECEYFNYPPDIIFIKPEKIGETCYSIGNLFPIEKIKSLTDDWDQNNKSANNINSVITELESMLVKHGMDKVEELCKLTHNNNNSKVRLKLDFDFVKDRNGVEILVYENNIINNNNNKSNRNKNHIEIHMLIPLWEISDKNGPPCIVGNDRFELFVKLFVNKNGDTTHTTLEFKVPALLPMTNASYKLTPYDINHDCLATYVPRCMEGFKSLWCKRRDFLNRFGDYLKFTLEYDTIDQSFRSFLIEAQPEEKKFYSAVVNIQMSPFFPISQGPTITIRTFSWRQNMNLIEVPPRFSPNWSIDAAVRFYINQIGDCLNNEQI